MTLITIRTSAHRNACIDGTTDEDIAAYDRTIDDYIEFLRARATEDGHQIALDAQPNLFGSSESTDDEGHEWLSMQPMFWDWYQQHA